MEPANRTEPHAHAPIRPFSGLNTSAVIVCVLSVVGALGIAAMSVPEIGSALGAVLSWMILLVFAICEFLWAAGAAVGVALAGLGLARRTTRNGAVAPAVVCLLLLVGYLFFAAVGPSLFFG